VFGLLYLSLSSSLSSRLTPAEKMEIAIKSRLEMNIPHMNNWSQAMAVGARPSFVCSTASILAEMFDEIWHICGDTSTNVFSLSSFRSFGVCIHSSSFLF
jgi:ubiquinone biosynthesis protein COQ9